LKLILSGGGTGGHVYPALAIAQAVRKLLPREEPLDILYVGAGGQESAIVARAGFPLNAISAAPIRGRMPWQMAANAGKIAAGTREARAIIEEFSPHVVLSTGGYASFPVAVAARTRGIPLAVYLPDLNPGWAVRAIARLAQRVAVTAVESLRSLPSGRTVVTGYPVREDFWQVDRAGGRERLGISPEEKVLFITGASSGAHSINQAVAAQLGPLLELCEVIHLCGSADERWLTDVRDALPEASRQRYHLYGYLHGDYAWALASSDLALCRSGASVMGELPAVKLPAVLVPYPYAGGHQRLNAQYLERNGAAVVLEDHELGEFLPLVGELLHDDARLRAMRDAARRLARPNAAARIAAILMDLAKVEAAA
jgi:UDP-N-acetylglucosamine--N-acetylmuramyl-(pentapeptide) pyrophosphoryl-undecaprenol N-acetylglucosamine transferase